MGQMTKFKTLLVIWVNAPRIWVIKRVSEG